MESKSQEFKIKIINKISVPEINTDDISDDFVSNILKEQEKKTINCIEIFDQKKLEILIQNIEDFKEFIGEEYEIQRSSLIRYYQASKNGKINTTYNQRENVGRYYATRGISLQNIKREFRHTISNGYYLDIDMENCQPRLLYQLCLKLKISCERLGEYVMNRDKILMGIDEDRDVGKNVILSLIFNGGKSYKNLKNKNSFIKDFKDEIKNIRTEIIFKFVDQYKSHRDKRVADGDKNNNHEGSFIASILCDIENKILMNIYDFYGRPKNAVLCYDGIMLEPNTELKFDECQNYVKDKTGFSIKLTEKKFNKQINLDKYETEEIKSENNCIMTIRENYYTEIVNEYKKVIPKNVRSYIIEALMKFKYQVRNIYRKDEKIFISIYCNDKCPLAKYNIEHRDEIHEELAIIFNINFLQYELKCFNEICQDEPEIVQYCDIKEDLKFNNKFIKKLNSKFVNEIGIVDMNNDEHRKKLGIFNDNVIKYTNTFFVFITGATTSLYYEIEYTSSGQRITSVKQSLVDILKSVEIVYEIANKNGVKKVTKNLCDMWIKSPKRREYRNVVVNPDKEKTKSNEFNLFDKFNITYEDCRSETADPSPIIDHIRNIWCKGSNEKFEYIMNWLAHCFQKPQEKTCVALVLLSNEGSGKGCILNKLRDIYGNRYYLHCQGYEDIFGNFNSILQGKCMTFLDEVAWGGMKKDSGRLKTFISEDNIVINQKGISKITMSSHNNVIMASNEDHAIPATEGSRRFFVCKLDNKFGGMMNENKKQYFDKILNVPATAFAKVLYERDISRFNPRNAPLTDDLQEQVEYGENSFYSFIRACAEGDFSWFIQDEYDSNVREDGYFLKSSVYKSYEEYKKSFHKSSQHKNVRLFWKGLQNIFGDNILYKTVKGTKYMKFSEDIDIIELLSNYIQNK